MTDDTNDRLPPLKKRSALRWSVVTLVVATMAIAIVTIMSRPTQNTSQTELRLRLKWLWYSGWAGELVTSEQRLWHAHGLDVEVRPGGFELDPIRLVAAGSDDIGVAGADQILLAREKGIPLVAFAAQYQESPVGFVAKASSEITKIEDFKGHRIGVKYGTDVEPIYRTLLEKVGLTEDDVDEVAVRFDLAPFLSGVIDVYPGYLTNDLLIPEERGFDVHTIRASDYGIRVYGNVYFCTENFLKTNDKTVVAFLRAVTQGWTAALDMPPDAIAALAIQKNDGLNPSHEARVAASLAPFIIPAGTSFGEMSADGWEQLYEMLRHQGILQQKFDYTEAFTLDVLHEVDRE